MLLLSSAAHYIKRSKRKMKRAGVTMNQWGERSIMCLHLYLCVSVNEWVCIWRTGDTVRLHVLVMKGQLRVTVIQLHSPIFSIDPSDSSDTLLLLYWHLTIQTNAGRHTIFQCLSSLLSRTRDANDQDCFQRACVPHSSTYFDLCSSLCAVLLVAMMSSRRCVYRFFFINTHLCFSLICLFSYLVSISLLSFVFPCSAHLLRDQALHLPPLPPPYSLALCLPTRACRVENRRPLCFLIIIT